MQSYSRKYCMELPPRARRIRHGCAQSRPAWGTTSACAENTAYGAARHLKQRNYLRVRGEYNSPPAQVCQPGELPPRARRIRATVKPPHGERVNYLRVRGEYGKMLRIFSTRVELPPRARRIPGEITNRMDRRGTTSACAENTMRCPHLIPQRGNYLRVRGEYSAPG